jgi:hypothetical protein
MHRTIPLLLLATLLTGAATEVSSQVVVTTRERSGLAITVSQGFGMIRDTRRVGGGTGELVWTDVARSIDPGTVLLLSGERPVDVAGLTYESDPGPYGLLGEGDRVTLVSPTGERIEATVASPMGLIYRAGDRLILEWKGHVEVPDPQGIRDPAPTIRWELAEPFAGGALTAAYLAGGLTWSADYVAIVGEDESMTLDGNVTIHNSTGTALPDATVQLVAGVVRRAGGVDPRMARAMEARGEALQMAGAPDIAREAIGEYHLYTVDAPVTLAREGTTQLGLFDAPRVPFERTLVLEGMEWRYQGRQSTPPPEHPEIRLRFRNERSAGLGEPLPAGVIHVYGRDAREALQFLGDGTIPHTPSGEEVRIAIGQAFDVTARRTQTDWRRLDERTEESAWSIELSNGGDRPRAVVIHETFPGEWTILAESRPHERVDARTARWTIEVPAGGSTALTYRVRVAY